MHMGTAPIPYFPFRSPGEPLGHLLWHTSPLSSPLCLLHLPRRCSPRRSFCFVCQDKSKQKARNKGRMLRGVLSLPNTGWTPPSPAAESQRPAPRPSGGGSQRMRWEGRGAPGAAAGAGPGAGLTHRYTMKYWKFRVSVHSTLVTYSVLHTGISIFNTYKPHVIYLLSLSTNSLLSQRRKYVCVYIYLYTTYSLIYTPTCRCIETPYTPIYTVYTVDVYIYISIYV